MSKYFSGLFMSGVLFGLSACGATTNAGVPTIGGAVGAPCNPANVTNGCNGSTEVQCQANGGSATTGKWQKIMDCPSGTMCKELADPNAVGSSKRNVECAVAATPTVNDTVSGSDAVGNNDAGSSDSSGGIEACMMQKCSVQMNNCLANISCKKAYDCLSGCKDMTCLNNCLAPLANDAPGKTAFQNLQTCSTSAQKVCNPASSDSGSNDTGTTDTGSSDIGKTDIGTFDSGSKDSGGSVCGNGTCDEGVGESMSNCAIDCNPKASLQGQCLESVCGPQLSACNQHSSCPIILSCAVNCLGDTSCIAACASDGTDPVSKAMFSCANSCFQE